MELNSYWIDPKTGQKSIKHITIRTNLRPDDKISKITKCIIENEDYHKNMLAHTLHEQNNSLI